MNDKEMECIYKQYANMVFRICVNCCKDTQTAKDLSQEIFIKIFNKIEYLKDNDSILTWIYKLSLNHCFDSLRKKKWRAKLIEKNFVSDYNPIFIQYSNTEAIIDKISINKVLNDVSDSLNEIIILKYYNDYSQSKISKTLGLSRYKVRKQINDWLIDCEKYFM